MLFPCRSRLFFWFFGEGFFDEGCQQEVGLRHFVECEVGRFKSAGFLVDDELNPGLHWCVLISTVASEFDDIFMIVAFEIFPLRIGKEIGKRLIVSPVRIVVRVSLFHHLDIGVFGMFRIAQSVLHVFSYAVGNATGAAGAKECDKCEEQAEFFHQETSFLNFLQRNIDQTKLSKCAEMSGWIYPYCIRHDDRRRKARQKIDHMMFVRRMERETLQSSG